MSTVVPEPPIISPAVARWLWTQKQAFRLARHRFPVLIQVKNHGRISPHQPENAHVRVLAWMTSQKAFSKVLWVSSGKTETSHQNYAVDIQHLPPAKYSSVLGQEFDCIVYDMFSGLHPDAFAALSGTLKAGGALILVGPELKYWSAFKDPEYQRLLAYPGHLHEVKGHFLTYLAQQINSSRHWTLIDLDLQDESPRFEVVRPGRIPRNLKTLKAKSISEEHSNSDHQTEHCPPTKEQQKLVNRILRLSPEKKNVIVVTAGRGRGKSAGLGIATKQWQDRFGGNIWVTGPAKATLNSYFRFLGTTSHVEFYPPDDLLHKARELKPEERPGLVIVDEAAAIPTSLLTTMAKLFPRLVFATTTHGYEGTGQGFSLKFFPVLSRMFPDWKQVSMSSPVRWQAYDPLERFIEKSFFLDSVTSPRKFPKRHDHVVQSDQAIQLSRLLVQHVPQPSLLTDKTLLQKLMQLLTMAHYRTTPDDLRTMLDAPGVKVYTVMHAERLVAAVLISMEEPFTETAVIEGIWRGERRPRGHLLQQSLAQQLSIKEGLTLPAARIIRVAVHPTLQHQGIGSQVLAQVKKLLKPEVSLLGASFAGEPEVVQFWLRNGYYLVRLGSKRDHISGTYAAMVLCATDADGRNIQRMALSHFQKRSRYNLHFNTYPSDTAELILKAQDNTLAASPLWSARQRLAAEDRQNLQLFASGARPFETVEHLLVRLPKVSKYESLQYIRRNAAHRLPPDLQDLAEEFELTGRKQAIQQLRKELTCWFEQN
ncbi:GNAT family N-acetyltransferase [Hahella ganghwensis]|uniref:GNAT family N-acetyltransferase n=1 Tax=Hahella ganghwensis TaxID=286420 RepID=UPI000380B5D0|nr:GNAT family N-acetyltransferase [Hahella ganghwensis]